MRRRSIGAHLLLWLMLLLGACVDLSGWDDGGFNQYPESPVLHGKTVTPPVLEDVVVTPPDIELPPTDVDFETLEQFALASVEPASGDIEGGEVVMLVGAGFDHSMEVFFGEAKATDPFVVDGHFATVVTPPHWPGAVDVRVVASGDRQAVLAAGYTYVAQLAVEAVEPVTGPASGGTPVTVAGQGFAADCDLFFGGHKASFVGLTDPFTLQAVTPSGHCGAADVTVVCESATARLKDGWYYEGLPRVDALFPKVIPAAGGIEVTLHGRNFTPHMLVQVEDAPVPAHEIVFLSPAQVRFRAPAGLPGPADLALTTACGARLLEDALVYGAADEGGTPAVLGVTPAKLPACAGGFLSVAMQAMGDPAWLQVQVGDAFADVVFLDEDLGAFDIEVPPLPAGTYDLQVLTADGAATWPDAVTMTPGMHLEKVTPASGHVGGGTEVTIAGCAIPDAVEVRFGSTTATVEAVGAGKVFAVTPPGSPGPVDVTVIGDGGAAVLPGAFSYVSDGPALYFLDPDYGSQAGGTYVRFHGAGLPPNATLLVGERECFDLHFVDSTTITARVPPNQPGSYEARVVWPGGEVSLTDAYTYFNPVSKSSGTWGGPIDEALNVTVLDGGTGGGLAAAFVKVGSDPDSPHKAFTDENGQVTFSVPGLSGPVQITAAKQGYSLYSVVHFDAENVTVYLNPTAPPSSSSGSYTSHQAWVGGRVLGLDKYVVIPPGNCLNKSVPGVLCDPCEVDADCLDDLGNPVGYCTDIGQTGRYCVTECLAPEDCPEGFACTKTGFEQTGCVPVGGTRAVRCESSKKSMFGSPPDPGPGGAVNAHDIYFINTVHGNLAVVCYGGYISADNGQFVPMVMGIRRNIKALWDQVLKDQDVTLDIPLNREGRVAFHDLPYHPEGTRKPYLLASIELGKEGYIALPGAPQWVEQGGYYRIHPLPAQMSGPLAGATFSLYSSVQSNTLYSMPYAVRLVEGVENLFGEGVIFIDAQGASPAFPPMTGHVVGIDYRAPDHLFVATDRGELLFYNGTVWTPVGLPGSKEGFTKLFADTAGDLWLGGKKGSVWHFDGTGWTRIVTGYPYEVRDLWAAAGKAVVLFPGFMATVNDFGLTETVAAPAGHQLTALWGADFEDLYVLSKAGTVWNRRPGEWIPLSMWSDYELVDVEGSGPDDVWVVGNPGLVLRYDGLGYEEYEVPEDSALRLVRALGPGQVWLGGADGLVLHLTQDGFAPVETGTLQDIAALDREPGGNVVAAGYQAYNLGPYMAYPRILWPSADEPFDFTKLSWEFWTPGAAADFHTIILSTTGGYSFWVLMVDGAVNEVTLPPIVQELGLNVLPDGPKRMNLTSSLNPDFNIDNYTSSDLSTWRKISWAVDLVNFE